MMRRNLAIAVLLALAWLIGTADRRTFAQEKSALDTRAEAPGAKAAAHATEGQEGPQGATRALAGQPEAIWPGMTRAGTVLLPNGWSLKPAGRQSRLGDLPVQIAVHPKEPILAIFHAGYSEHEVITVDATTGRMIGRVTLPTSFSGLVWSDGGERLFAGGGFDDRIYRFDHAEGLLSNKKVFDYPDRNAFLAEPNPREGQRAKTYQRVPCGLALAKDGKPLYVTAVFGHSLGRFDAESGAFLGEIPHEGDSYPYGLALDESREQLYVSLWSKAKIVVVNTGTFQVNPAIWAQVEAVAAALAEEKVLSGARVEAILRAAGPDRE